MEISDSSPERRNLTVLSVLVILFYIGGARLTEQHLSLPMINVKFTQTWALVAALWVALIWFVVRYWQTWRFEGRAQVREDMASFYSAEPVSKYLTNELRSDRQRAEYTVTGIHLDGSSRHIIFDAKITHKMENGKLREQRNQAISRKRTQDIKGKEGNKLLVRLWLRALIFRQGLLSYYFPYVLAFAACSLGAKNLFQ